MTIPIIHLSDIHFKATDEPLIDRARAIARAAAAVSPGGRRFTVVVSGDLAFSGRASEYVKVREFIDALTNELAGADVVLVPGNHDCDFENDSATRRAAISSVAQGGEVDDSIALTCTSIQNSFFDLLSVYSPGVIVTPMDRVSYVIEIARDNTLLRFTCYNTAWVSKIHEEQQLCMPSQALRVPNGDKAVEIAVTHHPNVWLRADSARQFREHLEDTSDLVLTGHEHAPSVYTKIHDDGRGANYSEAAALRPSDDAASGFTLLIIDPARATRTAHVFAWSGSDYLLQRTGATPLRYNRGPRLTLAEEFRKTLASVGAPFDHPWKSDLALRDIFVYPDIELRPLHDSAGERTFVAGAELASFALDRCHLLIAGADESGKTALSKVLFDDLYGRDLYPVLLAGEAIVATTEASYDSLIEHIFRGQYDRGSAFETYRTLGVKSRVLIIDDFDSARVNARGLRRFIQWAKQYFGTIICFVNEIFEFQGVAEYKTIDHPLIDFTAGQIRELGYVLRGRLIEKWYLLGREDVVEPEELADSVDAAERAIDTVLGSNLCPAHPVFVLAVLQAWESQQSVQTVSGSYGQVYEALIARALTSKKHKLPPDAKYAVLSMAAFFLFEAEKRWLDDTDLDGVLYEYSAQFGLSIDRSVFQKELCAGQILTKADGVYKFSHKYVYYYFAARYIRDFMLDRGEQGRVDAVVQRLTASLHNEDASNVLIFLVYLTKSDMIIDKVVAGAEALFAGVVPCDLESHVQFLNDFAKGHAREKLLIHPAEEARETVRRQRDARAAIAGGDQSDRKEVFQLNRALKTIQVLGQVLRNFPGSLRSDRKLRVARATYGVGLRALNFILGQFEAGWEEARDVVAEFLRCQRDFQDEYELQQSTDEFMFMHTRAVAYFFLRKISYAVGSEHLRTTYDQLISEQPTTAVKLLDTAVRLDQFRPVDADVVVDVYRELHKNFLAAALLRRFVRDHLYLYPVKVEKKQSLCSRLGIAFDNPAFLNVSAKRLK